MPIDYSQAARIAYLQWLDAEDRAEEAEIRTLRDYASGEHPVFLTDRQKEFIGLDKSGDHLFAHNLCELVISLAAERMGVTGFTPASGDQDADESPVSMAAAAWWELNRMDAIQDDLYSAALRDGVAYLIVDWDAEAGLPRWYINEAYDGTQGVTIFRDPETDAVMFAAKRWQMDYRYGNNDAGLTRLTLYFPDRVERYIQRTDRQRPDNDVDSALMRLNWRTYRDSNDDEWPIMREGADGKPLGLPVIPFVNPGGSEIASVLALQDMLNKSDLDLIATADHAGFRILYAAGLGADIDPETGLEREITVSPGQMLRMTDPQARLGAIDPADLARLISTCRYWIEGIAGQSRTPHYMLIPPSGMQPSGEALKEQEVGLKSKCERKQRVWGNSWEDAIYLSLRLANVYGGTALNEGERLQTQWADIERRSEKDKGEAAMAKQNAGVAPEITWAEDLGMTEAEIQRNLTLKAEAQQRQVATFGQAAARAARLRDQGMEV